MTTVAYRNGVLAADSRAVCNGWKQPHEVQKLFQMTDGTVCGVTGEFAVSVALVRWLDGLKDAPAPSLGDGGRVIHLQHDGSLVVYEGAGAFDLRCEWTAFGSGSPAAQAAMHMGADAVRAVEIAALLDDATGGTITSLGCRVAPEAGS